MRRLPQRLLAVELRTEIDRARRRPWDTQAARRALDLARSHPDGLRSAHVKHNIGPERLAWLARAQARACQVDPNPLVGEKESKDGPDDLPD